MIINFRQGIIDASEVFITLANNVVSINASQQYVDLAFAYGSANYLFSEVENVIGAWSGPFLPGTNYWLYWDIDMTSGLRTFGTTIVQPSYGSSLPTTNLQINQHYFNTASKMMNVWNGVSWDVKLRVFAGQVQNGAILIPQTIGASQVGLAGITPIGYILYDTNDLPVTRPDGNGNNFFVTTEDKVHTQFDVTNGYKIDGLVIDGTAIEPIPAFYCVCWKGPRELGVASYVNYQYPVIGVSVEATATNDVNQFVTKGFLTNYGGWNWTQAAGTPLFVDALGNLTVTVPQQYSFQKVGHIVSPDTIFVDYQEQILIDNVYITPTPSATFTPSPTLTPTLTSTATQTVTATPSPTPSPSASYSPTPTPSVTQTPSVTITPTMSVSPTPSVTPSPSAVSNLLTNESSIESYGVSGENTVVVSFYSSSLCPPPNLIANDSITEVTSFVCNYWQYADNPTSNADSNCQRIAPTVEGSIISSGSFTDADASVNQYSGNVWYYESLPGGLLGILEAGNIVVESIWQTNMGQITSYLVTLAF